MSLVERLQHVDATLGERLERAIKENDQIEHAFGVPERVAKLVADRLRR